MRSVQRATGLFVTCRPLTVEHLNMLLKCFCTPIYGIRPRYKNHIVMLYIYVIILLIKCQYLFSLFANFLHVIFFHKYLLPKNSTTYFSILSQPSIPMNPSSSKGQIFISSRNKKALNLSYKTNIQGLFFVSIPDTKFYP